VGNKSKSRLQLLIFSFLFLNKDPAFVEIYDQYVQCTCIVHRSLHTKNQHPRLSRSPRKERADREEERGEKRREEERGITVLIEATTFAWQPVCNTTRAAHALRSDQQQKL
jgi:hypothetical protein